MVGIDIACVPSLSRSAQPNIYQLTLIDQAKSTPSAWGVMEIGARMSMSVAG
mgnify:CR=1 FL=1